MALKPLSAIECNPIKMTLPISAEKKEEGVYNYSWKPDWPGPIRAPVVTTYIHSEAWSLTSPSSSFVLPTKCSATESSTFEQVISIMQTYHLRWNEHRWLYSSCVTPHPLAASFLPVSLFGETSVTERTFISTLSCYRRVTKCWKDLASYQLVFIVKIK